MNKPRKYNNEEIKNMTSTVWLDIDETEQRKALASMGISWEDAVLYKQYWLDIYNNRCQNEITRCVNEAVHEQADKMAKDNDRDFARFIGIYNDGYMFVDAVKDKCKMGPPSFFLFKNNSFTVLNHRDGFDIVRP